MEITSNKLFSTILILLAFVLWSWSGSEPIVKAVLVSGLWIMAGLFTVADAIDRGHK